MSKGSPWDGIARTGELGGLISFSDSEEDDDDQIPLHQWHLNVRANLGRLCSILNRTSRASTY